MKKNLIRATLFLFAVVMGSELMLIGQAAAISNVGPDPNDYSAGNEVWLEVSKSGEGNSLEATTSIVTLYFRNPSNNTVRIQHEDQCRYSSDATEPPGNRTKDSDRSPSNWPYVNQANRGNTRFTVTSGGTQRFTTRNTVHHDRRVICENSSRVFTLNNLARSTQVGLENFYEAEFRADILNPVWAAGSVNAFKVRVGAGNFVSFSRNSGDRFALQQRGLNGGTEYHNFNLRFGPDCGVKNRQLRTLRWFDDDQGASNQSRTIYFQLLRRPQGSTGGFAVMGPSVLLGAKANGNFVPAPGGNDRTRSTQFYVDPGYEYIWRWRNVQTQNGIQFRIPFDSIFFVTGCQLHDLRPIVTGGPATANQGDNVSFNYRVRNQGPTVSPDAQWRILYRVIGAGAAPWPEQDTNRANFPNQNSKRSGSGVNYRPGVSSPQGALNGTHSESYSLSALGVDPGEKLCTSIGVNPAETGVNWRYSAERCVVVVQRPTVHFMGGDLSVGNPYQSASANCSLRPGTGSVYTVATTNNNGSVAEYASFVRRIIEFNNSAGRGFGTGSQPGTTALDIRKLSFANTQTNDQYGRFGNNDCMTDYYEKFSSEIAVNGGSGTVSLSGSELRHYSGNVTINASNIANGAKIVIVADGDVTINGNITYGNAYTNRNEIPSVAIISRGDITINGSVTQLDGAYISKGTIHTCHNKSGSLTSNICDQPLTINGMIMTDGLNLRRTFGGDNANPDKPAERFNFTSEMFFNNVLDDGANNAIDTVEQRDLPPRY